MEKEHMITFICVWVQESPSAVTQKNSRFTMLPCRWELTHLLYLEKASVIITSSCNDINLDEKPFHLKSLHKPFALEEKNLFLCMLGHLATDDVRCLYRGLSIAEAPQLNL